MKIWKNTSTLNGFDDGLEFTSSKDEASVALLGSKPINLNEFKNLKGIFRAGIGRDNVPEKEAKKKNIIVKYPSRQTKNIIFRETAYFTCNLIFRMFYQHVGTINPWSKSPRVFLAKKTLLVIGKGKVGNKVIELMKSFMDVISFDIYENNISELKSLIKKADCISLHIPLSNKNISFFDSEKLSWMKDDAILVNTSRGPIVCEDSLYEELNKKRIKAAFDVYWFEPYNGKLTEFHPDYFYMTPHVASTCKDFLIGCRESLNDLLKKLTMIRNINKNI